MFLAKHFGTDPPTTELEDVIQNLNHVLKTRRGAGYFLESFGLSDVGYRTPEEMIVSLTRELTENVRLYEPRVELVRIDEEYDDDGKRSHLLVDLRLRSAKEGLRIVVDLKRNSFDVAPVERR